MLLATSILLLSDAFAWIYRGHPDRIGFYVVRVSNFHVFLFSDVILALFHGYVCCCLFDEPELQSASLTGSRNLSDVEEKKKRRRERRTRIERKAVYLIALVAAVLVLISQFTGLYYTFDAQNLYHRNLWYPLALLLPLAGMLVDAHLILVYRQQLTGRLLLSLVSYIFLPFVASVAQIFYYGISLVNIAINISMILMFVESMIEQARIVAIQERKLGEQKLKLAEGERKVAEQNRKIAEQERELTETRIATMISQIKPHFIYNTLGSIEQLCEIDPEIAAEMTHNFAKYLRGNFGELGNRNPVRLSQEINHCQYYVSIEKIRFPDIDITFDLQSEDFLIPALSVQPLIENAIKHGLMKLPNGGKIKVSSYETKEMYYVKVEDNGAGFAPGIRQNDRSHIGLNNIRGRLQAMCDGNLTVESTPGEGTEVRIQIPKKKKEV